MTQCTLDLQLLSREDSKTKKAPLPSNTGALSTLVDYVGVTFPLDVTLIKVKEFIGGDGWIERPRGGMYYKNCAARGHIRVYYNGREDMGVHVVLSGQACRQLEGEGRVKDWPFFFGRLLVLGCEFSRIDLAIDDRDGLLDLKKIWQHWKAGEMVSRYRKARQVEEVESRGCKESGHTIYFGSGHAETLVRFYDKALEQMVEGPWIRCELQCRDDKAQALAQVLERSGTLSTIGSVLKQLVDFKEVGQDSNKSRWKTVSWWTDFIRRVKKCPLTVEPHVRSVEDAAQWLLKAVAPTLAMVSLACEDSLTFFQDLLRLGMPRMQPWHKQALAVWGNPG